MASSILESLKMKPLNRMQLFVIYLLSYLFIYIVSDHSKWGKLLLESYSAVCPDSSEYAVLIWPKKL